MRDYGTDAQLGLERTPDCQRRGYLTLRADLTDDQREFVARRLAGDDLLEYFEDAACGECYVCHMVAVFREVRRMLRSDGTLFLNLGDSYAGSTTLGRNDAGRNFTGGGGNLEGSGNPGRQGEHYRDAGLKPKDLVGIPWRVAFALQADGWYLRSDIIWAKPNPMPESVTDRPTKAHEYLFLLTKNARYHYDAAAIAERAIHAGEVVVNDNGKNAEMGDFGQTRTGFLGAVTVKPERNKRTVWTIATQPYKGAHFATMPEALVEPCIGAGCPPGGVVLDPFTGSGTVGAVALRMGRQFVGVELNPAYLELAQERMRPWLAQGRLAL